MPSIIEYRGDIPRFKNGTLAVSKFDRSHWWERVVQIVKRALLLNLGSAKLTRDVFSTIVIETKSLVNARPLTHVRSDIEDEDPLTPNHFLIGRAFPNVPALCPTIQTKTWTQVRQRLEAIWKRLLKEYIPTLNARKKWTKPDAKLEVNDVVWVLEEWTPRGIWPWDVWQGRSPAPTKLLGHVK